MNDRIIFTNGQFNERDINVCALIDSNNHFIKVHCSNPNEQSNVGGIFIGKVATIQNNINAAFVEIANKEVVYLPLEKAENIIYTNKFASNDRLCQGDEILIQIEKDAIKTKKAIATTNLNFESKHMVLTTGNNSIGVSRKINEAIRDDIKARFNVVFSNCPYGFVIRTNAEAIDIDDLLSEARELLDEVQNIVSKSMNLTAFSTIKKPKDCFTRFVETIKSDEMRLVDEVLTDDRDCMSLILDNGLFDEDINVRLYEDDTYSMWMLLGINSELERISKTKVWLNSGAYLLIEPTETMTVIDVNSGKNIKKDDLLKINKEAADEIVRQLIVRNISGMILIDFINLPNKDQQRELFSYMRQISSNANANIQVLDYTKLGLVEVTKKKEHPSIYQQLSIIRDISE